MGNIFAVGGAKFYIGNASMAAPDPNTTLTVSDFAAVTWIEVKGWLTVGAYGGSSALITSQRVAGKRDMKGKGTTNEGSMQNTFAHVPSDSGQAAMKAAQATDFNYPFKVVHDDEPDGGTKPTTDYFVGLVMTWQRAGGNANAERTYNSTIELNSNVATDEAA